MLRPAVVPKYKWARLAAERSGVLHVRQASEWRSLDGATNRALKNVGMEDTWRKRS